MELPGNRDKKIIDGTHRIVFTFCLFWDWHFSCGILKMQPAM